MLILSLSFVLCFTSFALAWDCPKCKNKNDDKNHCSKCDKCGHMVKFNIPCPKCKKPVPLGDSNCKHCNAKLPDVWTCGSCGKICPGNANNCMKCGKAKPGNSAPKKDNKKPEPKVDAKTNSEPDFSREEYTSEAPCKYRKLGKSKKDRKTKALIKFYTRNYSKHLKSRDWFIRALSVVAISKINAKLTTSKLFSILKKDKKPLVKLYAWECLRARSHMLSKSQHKEWVALGARLAFKLKKKSPFKGDLRVGLINAMAGYGPSKVGLEYNPRKIVLSFIKSCNIKNPSDSRTLTALRALVKRWHDPKLTKQLLGKLGNIKTAQKYEYLLGDIADGIDPLLKFGEKVSSADWGKKRGQYHKWYKNANLKEFAEDEIVRYTGKSPWIADPEFIKNPDEKKWKEDLELEKLKVHDIDLCFAIDSTGSMLPAMQWLAGDLPSLTNALELICREPRVGAVYYRHEIHNALMRDCCKKAGPNSYYEVIVGGAPKGAKRVGDAADGLETVKIDPKDRDKIKLRKILDYRQRYYQLTSKIKKLTSIMASQEAGGKHVNPAGHKVKAPGAIHAGLYLAIKKMKWKKSKKTEKIIILIGDVGATDKSMPYIEKLVKAAKKKDFKFITLHALLLGSSGPYHPKQLPNVVNGSSRLQVPDFKKIMGWADGVVNYAQFTALSDYKGKQIADPPSQFTNYNTTLTSIIQQIIPAGYHKRLEPIVNVLCEYSKVNPRRSKKSRSRK